nr:uncharacterized protein LOC128671499 [Plodia interpunctella]
MALENTTIQITSEYVRGKLLTEFSRTSVTEMIEPDTAMSVQCKKRNKKKEIICFNCKKPGHKKPDCPILKKKREGEEKGRSSNLLCALNGHTVGEINKDKW